MMYVGIAHVCIYYMVQVKTMSTHTLYSKSYAMQCILVVWPLYLFYYNHTRLIKDLKRLKIGAKKVNYSEETPYTYRSPLSFISLYKNSVKQYYIKPTIIW